jgi:hypothetical protein
MVASGIFVTMRTPRSSVSAAPLVVCFSDVDGTLMDERERLIIDRDDAAGFASFMELVLTSSRTLVELARIQRRLGLVAPLIGENGAVVGLPPRWRGGRSPGLRRVGGRSMQVIPLGQPAVTVRSRTRRCARAASVRIVEQRDLLPDRGRSLRRTHSVCVRNWRGPAAERFLAALRDAFRAVDHDYRRCGQGRRCPRGPCHGGAARCTVPVVRGDRECRERRAVAGCRRPSIRDP